jgi:hypothetical protein
MAICPAIFHVIPMPTSRSMWGASDSRSDARFEALATSITIRLLGAADGFVSCLY